MAVCNTGGIMVVRKTIDWLYNKFLAFRVLVDTLIILALFLALELILNLALDRKDLGNALFWFTFLISLAALAYEIRRLRGLEPWRKPGSSKEAFMKMDPYEFEIFVSHLLNKMGYETRITRKSKGDHGSDFGVDIIAKKNGNIIAVQVKKWAPFHLVGAEEVQKLLGAKYKYKADKCILITTSDFTEQAYEQAKDAPIELWNGKYLDYLIEKYAKPKHVSTSPSSPFLYFQGNKK